MPACILLHSTKGKGVSFMENNVDWHGKAPDDAEYAAAMADLEKIDRQLQEKTAAAAPKESTEAAHSAHCFFAKLIAPLSSAAKKLTHPSVTKL